jgi:hypothetical protein
MKIMAVDAEKNGFCCLHQRALVHPAALFWKLMKLAATEYSLISATARN